MGFGSKTDLKLYRMKTIAMQLGAGPLGNSRGKLFSCPHEAVEINFISSRGLIARPAGASARDPPVDSYEPKDP
jgi:hypothetical protein